MPLQIVCELVYGARSVKLVEVVWKNPADYIRYCMPDDKILTGVLARKAPFVTRRMAVVISIAEICPIVDKRCTSFMKGIVKAVSGRSIVPGNRPAFMSCDQRGGAL